MATSSTIASYEVATTNLTRTASLLAASFGRGMIARSGRAVSVGTFLPLLGFYAPRGIRTGERRRWPCPQPAFEPPTVSSRWNTGMDHTTLRMGPKHTKLPTINAGSAGCSGDVRRTRGTRLQRVVVL
ncbi:hypothetical protein MTO96_031707 [Rhipicephalus appendiculatus]